MERDVMLECIECRGCDESSVNPAAWRNISGSSRKIEE